MKGNNAKFKADPAKFLESTGIICPQMARNSNVGDFAAIRGAAVKEFDLVPNGKFVELKVLGDAGTYAATKRRGSPIAGHFLHWNGQTFKQGCATFGSLDLSSCTGDYVFTAPFTGCRFVVVKIDGRLQVYHEPTEQGDCAYPGEVVLKLGPEYAKGKAISGNGVIVRRDGGWRVIVSTLEMGAAKAKVASSDI